MAKSRFSVSRLENIIEKTAKSLGTIRTRDPIRKGKVFRGKIAVLTELTKRRNTAKMRGG